MKRGPSLLPPHLSLHPHCILWSVLLFTCSYSPFGGDKLLFFSPATSYYGNPFFSRLKKRVWGGQKKKSARTCLGLMFRLAGHRNDVQESSWVCRVAVLSEWSEQRVDEVVLHLCSPHCGHSVLHWKWFVLAGRTRPDKEADFYCIFESVKSEWFYRKIPSSALKFSERTW